MTDEELRAFNGNTLSHCWYSPTWDEQYGHIIYSIDGVEHKVSNASVERSEKALSYNYPDSIYLGKGIFVRRSDKWTKTINEIFVEDPNLTKLENMTRSLTKMVEMCEVLPIKVNNQ